MIFFISNEHLLGECSNYRNLDEQSTIISIKIDQIGVGVSLFFLAFPRLCGYIDSDLSDWIL